MATSRVERAQGCLLGQLAGDALGSLVEFKNAAEIRHGYPNGVRDMADGGAWNTIAGQPTDDSEMALALARMLVEHRKFDPIVARAAYVQWLDSGPFDCGVTVFSGLKGAHKHDSQANGALMRISPLGIFGSGFDLPSVADWAVADANITHPHKVCTQVNSLFAMAIAYATASGAPGSDVYAQMLLWCNERDVEPAVRNVVTLAAESPPACFEVNQGWVLIAFQNAVYQLLNAQSLEQGVVDTVMRGGDTDTNAAICGALLGSVYGVASVPERWVRAISSCKPVEGVPRVARPRPQKYWPSDALDLAESLVMAGTPN